MPIIQSHSFSGVTLGSLRLGDWKTELSIDFDLDIDLVVLSSRGECFDAGGGVWLSDIFLVRDKLRDAWRLPLLTFDVWDTSRLVFDFERERLSRERLLRLSLPAERRFRLWCERLLLRDVRLCDLLDLDDDEWDLRNVEANFFDLCSSCNFDFCLLKPENYVHGKNDQSQYLWKIHSLLRFRRFLEYERLLDLDEYERLLLLDRESDLTTARTLKNDLFIKVFEYTIYLRRRRRLWSYESYESSLRRSSYDEKRPPR